MKSAPRILTALIAVATLVILTNCSKDSQNNSVANSSDASYEEGNSLMERMITSTGSNFRMMPNSKSDVVVPALCGSTTKSFAIGADVYGDIEVGNDATDYYFTVSGANGWMLKKIRLYAGDGTTIPLNGGGLPQFNDYPVNHTFSSPYPTLWSFSIPIADLGNSIWVSVRIDYVNGTGTEAGVWSEGDPFKAGNPSSKFNYVYQECVVDEGCSFGQGYWYGNGNLSWPDVNGASAGDVTVGNENYTRDEARAIWWANNGNCPGIPDAKKAFAFVSSIMLSGNSVIGNTDLWNDVASVNNWLESLNRLSDVNICNHPSAPASVKDAVARMCAWMDDHKCE